MNGYIYITQERNSDGSVITHNGLTKIGVGRTNNSTRRFKEHNNGSKSTVGVDFLKIVDCDDLGKKDGDVESKVHETLLKLGYEVVERKSSNNGEEGHSVTEVFSGTCKKEIEGVVKKDQEISVELILDIIKKEYNVDLFKDKLNLYPHQNIGLEFIKDRFNHTDEVLLNCKPRSGKTYISYAYLIEEKPQNVLLLTQYPSLNDQWKDDFEKLRDHDYNIVISRDVDKVTLNDDRPNFVLISLQDAKGGEEEETTDDAVVKALKKQKFSKLIGVTWDLVIFDEIHKGKETTKTDKLLEKLNYKKLLGLSATPTKNILRGTFSAENIFRYTLKEEREYKIKFPELYKNPNINHMLFNISDEVKKEMKYFTKEEGFTFGKFSRVADGRLVYENDHIQLFSWLFGKGRWNKLSPSFKIVNKCKSLLFFVNNNECQEHIKTLLENAVGDVYDIHFTNSEVNSSKTLMKKVKKQFKPKNGKKSIIIANRQLTTGITLEECDGVIFLNDWKSVDEYIQASFRCQSTSEGKEDCYVIDLNPARAFNILYNYIEENSVTQNRNVETEISEYLECAPIYESFGSELKKIDFEAFKSKVVEHSGIGDKFFPKSITMPYDSVEGLSYEILSLGKLNSDNIVSERVKLDEDGLEEGTNKNKIKGDGDNGESKDAPTKEETNMMSQILSNIEFIRDRLHIMGIATEFKYDSVDEVFEILNNDEEIRDRFLEELMIGEILK